MAIGRIRRECSAALIWCAVFDEATCSARSTLLSLGDVAFDEETLVHIGFVSVVSTLGCAIRSVKPLIERSPESHRPIFATGHILTVGVCALTEITLTRLAQQQPTSPVHLLESASNRVVDPAYGAS